MKEDVLKVRLMVQEQIEKLRLEMQEIALDKDLTDPRVVRVSEKLDLLINEFYIAKRRKQYINRGLCKTYENSNETNRSPSALRERQSTSIAPQVCGSGCCQDRAGRLND
jgi:hypothetical protein